MAIATSRVDPGVDESRASNLAGEPSWFEPTTNYIYLVIAAALAAVALYDFVTPLGVSGWVFYCIPIVIAFLLWHPAAPLIVAGAATVLSAIGFMVSPANSEAIFAIQNRSFAAATYWVLGIAGFLFIRGKLTLKKQEWLQAAEVGLAQKDRRRTLPAGTRQSRAGISGDVPRRASRSHLRRRRRIIPTERQLRRARVILSSRADQTGRRTSWAEPLRTGGHLSFNPCRMGTSISDRASVKARLPAF